MEEEKRSLEELLRGWTGDDQEEYSQWMGELKTAGIKNMDRLKKRATSSRWENTLGTLSDGLVSELEVWRQEKGYSYGIQIVGQKRKLEDYFEQVVPVVKHLKRYEEVEEGIEEEIEMDIEINFLKMKAFPPLMHQDRRHPVIMERDCYRTIFDQLLEIIQSPEDANITVSGNPGIGKSRFILYCMHRLIVEDRLGTRSLVFNHRNKYELYRDGYFVRLSPAQIDSCEGSPDVIRLIDASSDRLLGWTGISILFGSPGSKDLNSFAKVGGQKFYMPPWTLEELQFYNLNSKGIGMEVAIEEPTEIDEKELEDRFLFFGGISRNIFSTQFDELKRSVNSEIVSGKMLELINFVKRHEPVKQDHYSHKLLHMIPSTPDYRTNFHLDFASQTICDLIVSSLYEQSLDALTEFSMSYSDPDTATLRGRIYEQLFHRDMEKGGITFHGKSLSDDSGFHIKVKESPVPKNWFVQLSDIPDFEENKAQYLVPKSKTFATLDSLYYDGQCCYIFQVTIAETHGISHKTLVNVLEWLQERNVKYRFVFVIPSTRFHSFKKQSYVTCRGKKTKRLSEIAVELTQYAITYDVVRE